MTKNAIEETLDEEDRFGSLMTQWGKMSFGSSPRAMVVTFNFGLQLGYYPGGKYVSLHTDCCREKAYRRADPWSSGPLYSRYCNGCNEKIVWTHTDSLGVRDDEWKVDELEYFLEDWLTLYLDPMEAAVMVVEFIPVFQEIFETIADAFPA